MLGEGVRVTRLSRRELHRADWRALVRLARWHGFTVANAPETPERRTRLVEALVRKLDAEDIAA